MSGPTLTLSGARGGHGTTTVATALAILAAGHGPTRLVSADAAALLGLPDVAGPDTAASVTERLTLSLPGYPEAEDAERITVVDAGPLGAATDTGHPTFVVLRGPCYLGLRHLVSRAGPLPVGIILFVEPERSLTRRDVEDVVGAPVVATVEGSPVVARTIDAGLLLARLDRLPQFRDLRALAQRLFGSPESQAVA